MILNKLKEKVKKIKPKWIYIIMLAILMVLSVIGIVFSSITFSKNVKISHSKDIGNKLNISYDLNLSKNSQSNNDQEILSYASNSLNQQLKNRNLQDYDLEYGIGKELNVLNPYTYGNLNMSFNLSDKELGFDQKLAINKLNDENIKESDRLSMASQLLAYFYKFNNNFNYRLQNNSKEKNPNFSVNSYALNSKKDKDTKPAVGDIKNNRVDIALLKRQSNDHKGYWDLSGFQKEFSLAFKDKWNEFKDHTKVIDALGNEYKYTEKPKNSYIFWINRSVLISKLQTSIMLTYLNIKYHNASGLTKFESFLVDDLIKNLTLDEKNFGYWVNELNQQNLILEKLNKSLDYESTNNTNSFQDPLIDVLKEYYNRPKDSYVPGSTDDEKKQLKQYSEYEFLYSWNTSQEKLINSYLTPIDYVNFFKFFNNNTNEFKDSSSPNDFLDNNYYSNKFLLDSNAFNSISKPNELANIINNYSFEQNIFNKNLYDLKDNIHNPKNILDIAKKFVNYVNVIEQQNLLSPIKLPTYLSTFIGILVIIFLIGIVVSVFYRIPGIFATIISSLNFTISSLFFSNLGLSFSIDSFLVSGIFAVLSFICILFYFKYFKEGIEKGFNIWNSFIYSFRYGFKMIIKICISVLIIGLSFLLFGVTVFQSFGSILIIFSLVTICISGLGFALVFFSFLFSISTKNFNLFLNNDYKNSIIKIQNSIYRNLKIEIPDYKYNSIFNKIILQFDVSFKAKRFLYFIGIVFISLISLIGLILLATIGFGISSDFSQIQQLIIKSNNPLAQDQINLIISKLNISIFNSKLEVLNSIDINNKFINVLQISSTKVNWNNLLNLINNQNFSASDLSLLGFSDINEFINATTIEAINNTNIFELKNNLVKCLLISIGFISIWILLTLNITNVIPIIILILFNVFIMLGVVNLFRIPFDKASLFSLSSNFIFNVVIIIITVSYIKEGIIKKNNLTNLELKDLIKLRTKNFFSIYLLSYLFYVCSNLLYMLFIASSFQFVLLLISISSIFLIFVNIFIIYCFIYWTTLLTKLFTKEQQHKSILKYFSKQKNIKETDKNSRKYKSFDKIDEQEIYGINKFS